MDIFEQASRLRLRFSFRGSATVEDLWELTVEELDSIFKTLNSKLKASQEESLLDTRTTEDESTTLSVAIIKHIVEIKLAEKDAEVNKKTKALERKRLLAILASKKDAELQGKTAAEIEAMIDAL